MKSSNLNSKILDRTNQESSTNSEEKLKTEFNSYLFKITNLINNFQLNVAVANIYEIYRLISSNLNEKISNKCLKKIMVDFMKILIPFTPHLASESLEILGEKKIDKWPELDEKLIQKKKVKIAIQINGKTREIIEIEKDLLEDAAIEESKKSKKVMRNLDNKKIFKTIFVKNKIINYLIK